MLADDEYFVLGDFTWRSVDSRFWEEGAVGHNPYAVPESHLHGVVTHIIWPPSRWRGVPLRAIAWKGVRSGTSELPSLCLVQRIQCSVVVFAAAKSEQHRECDRQ